MNLPGENATEVTIGKYTNSLLINIFFLTYNKHYTCSFSYLYIFVTLMTIVVHVSYPTIAQLPFVSLLCMFQLSSLFMELSIN